MEGKNKNKARSAPVTPEHHQEVDFDEEGEETEEEDQQDEHLSIHRYSQEAGQRLVRQTEPGDRCGEKIDQAN